MDFKSLKANRAANAEAIKNKLAGGDTEYAKDDRYWRLTTDKETGNGSAVIRFLPAPQGEEMPYQEFYRHSFKGPGGWYIELSRTSLGKDERDPVMEYNKKLWDSETDENPGPNRKLVSEQYKRRKAFVANIKVIDDQAHPENNGKVFLYNFGPMIMDMINDLMHPADGDNAVAVNPFDLWEGANFKLVSRKQKGFIKYDKSKWEDPSPAEDSDEELEQLWLSEHSLAAEVAPSKFKSYEDLLKSHRRAMKLEDVETSKPSAKARTERVIEDEDDEIPVKKSAPVDDEGDPDLAFLRGLSKD